MAFLPDIPTEIAPLHTLTASDTSGTYIVVLPRGALGDPLIVRIQYFNASQASGTGVWTFTAQVSYNEGSTWTTVATGAAITLSTTVQNAEQALSFTPSTLADSGQVWIQVLATLSGSGVTPTIAYRADLVMKQPIVG